MPTSHTHDNSKRRYEATRQGARQFMEDCRLAILGEKPLHKGQKPLSKIGRIIGALMVEHFNIDHLMQHGEAITWVGEERLAMEASVTSRTVRAARTELRDKGIFIVREKGGGRQRGGGGARAVYQLNVEWFFRARDERMERIRAFNDDRDQARAAHQEPPPNGDQADDETRMDSSPLAPDQGGRFASPRGKISVAKGESLRIPTRMKSSPDSLDTDSHDMTPSDTAVSAAPSRRCAADDGWTEESWDEMVAEIETYVAIAHDTTGEPADAIRRFLHHVARRCDYLDLLEALEQFINGEGRTTWRSMKSGITSMTGYTGLNIVSSTGASPASGTSG